MLRRRAAQKASAAPAPEEAPPLRWMRAAYRFHTFAYRDPRSAFSSAVGLPVVSPTTALLGMVSTLYSIGDDEAAREILSVLHRCRVAVDAPDGVVFFRAFHQLRRYYSTRKGNTARAGFTNVSQGTREYGLVDGVLTLYVGVPEAALDGSLRALRFRDHLGTHDSLCSLVGDVVVCDEPVGVVYLPPERWQNQLPEETGVTIVTLSRFRQAPVRPVVGERWWMSGGRDTELVPFLIRGQFRGTSRGKVFAKRVRATGVE